MSTIAKATIFVVGLTMAAGFLTTFLEAQAGMSAGPAVIAIDLGVGIVATYIGLRMAGV